MIYDHEAIVHAYPGISITIHDDLGIFNDDGTEFVVDNDKVVAARAELDSLKISRDTKTSVPTLARSIKLYL